MNRIHRAANKALAITLTGAIIATGAFAVHLTHVHASVTVTFGDAMPQQVLVADELDIAQLAPLPQRKPKVSK
ncbi:unnamed protein product [Sphagnum balticum]